MAWQLRTQDGDVYEADSKDRLLEWAKMGRIQPGQEISEDGESWTNVVDVPFLDMRWAIDIGDGTPRGPFNKVAAQSLLDSGRLPKGSKLIEMRPPFGDDVRPGSDETKETEPEDAKPALNDEELAKVREQLKNLEAVVAAQKEELARRDESIVEFKAQVTARDAALAQRKDEVSRLDDALVKRKAELAERDDKVRAVILECDGKTKAMAAECEAKIRSAGEKCDKACREAEGKVEAAVARIVELETAQDDLSKQLAARDGAIETGKNELKLRDSTIESLKGELHLSAEQCGSLTKEVAALKEALQRQKDETLTLTSEIERLPSNAKENADIEAAVYSVMEDEMQDLEAEIAASAKEAEEARLYWQARSERLLERRRALVARMGFDSKEMVSNALRSGKEDPRLKQLRHDYSALKILQERTMQESGERIASLTAEVERLQTENNSLRMQSADAALVLRQLEEMEAQLRERERELMQVRQQHEEEKRQSETAEQVLMARVSSLEEGIEIPFTPRQKGDGGSRFPSWMGLR